MPNNPKLSAHVGGYVDPALKQRANRITKRAPRLNMSRIIEECLANHLRKIERRLDATQSTHKEAI